MTNPNREIYDSNYSDANLRLAPSGAYDKGITDVRFGIIRKYAAGKDVLDLCCGTGSFILPVLDIVKSAVAADFSSSMISGLLKNIGDKKPKNLSISYADAQSLPFKDDSFDFIFSYTSLYYVPDLAAAFSEAARVLRRGGIAALEVGNRHSMNTVICAHHYRHSGWAKVFAEPFAKTVSLIEGAGLRIIERRSFQLLSMYGAPKRFFFLMPFASEKWKIIMGLKIHGRMLDEHISGAWPFRLAAFRHIFIVEKI